MIENDVKQSLLATLNETVGQGKVRTSVLVLGEGLNIQAAGMRGREPKDGWRSILESLWKHAGGDDSSFERLRSSALQWTCLVELYARSRSMNLNAAEKALQTTLCRRLKRVESEVESKSLYAQILDANFANVVWFSVDRRIVRHVSRSRFANLPAKGSLLYRRVRMGHSRDSDATNIWFPYGDVSEPSSIQIGHANFDQRLMQYEDYRDGMMRKWFDWDSSYSGYELRPPAEVYWRLWNGIESWYELFFLAPLVFVGVSLSPDDWPLWWLLHQRSRNFVPFRNDEVYRCPGTFYVTCKGSETDHLRGAPAGIELVEFDSYDAMWSFLTKALAKKPK